jgi:hypothetical protein
MIKRLNFLWDENISTMKEKLELDEGNYKDVLDFAITQTLIPSPFIKPGPYLGIVLREDISETDTLSSLTVLGTWISEKFGESSPDGARLPVPLDGYKVRIPELDAAIPEPPHTCATPKEESDAQKWIEMHTTFITTPDKPKATIGQVVWVDFEDYKTKNNPIYIGPFFDSNGETQSISPYDMSEGAKAAFDKCAAYLGGDPDGWSIKKMWNRWIGGDGGRVRYVGEDSEIEPDEKPSENPKNTYPRECSLLTSRNIDNTPDNKDEEDNLKYLEEEVIPVLLPIMKEVDSRFVITSVYRSDALNKAVGGAEDKITGEATSFHAKGLAIDFGGLSGIDKVERDKIFTKALDHLKENNNRVPMLRKVIAELWRNHIHISIFQPPKQSGTTEYKLWKTEKPKMEEYVGK